MKKSERFWELWLGICLVTLALVGIPLYYHTPFVLLWLVPIFYGSWMIAGVL